MYSDAEHDKKKAVISSYVLVFILLLLFTVVLLFVALQFLKGDVSPVVVSEGGVGNSKELETPVTNDEKSHDPDHESEISADSE